MLLCSQLFLASMALVFFAKAFGGAYMKSSITQIERRFDIPSSLIGVIDGSFEMGMYRFFSFFFTDGKVTVLYSSSILQHSNLSKEKSDIWWNTLLSFLAESEIID